MSYHPKQRISLSHNPGEYLMSHKPNDNSNATDKPRVVSVTATTQEQEATGEKPEAQATPTDKKLRVAEPQVSEEIKNNIQQSVDLAETMTGGAANVDKIRDILFGGQMRDYDKRFKRLEERVEQETAHFRDDMLQRFKALEERMSEEIDSLLDKVKVERQERQNNTQALEQEMKTLKTDINNRLTQIDEQMTKDMKNLRQQTHNKLQELSLQLRQQGESLTGLISQEIAQLQEEKVNRSDLAMLFNELALRFSRFENSSELE